MVSAFEGGVLKLGHRHDANRRLPCLVGRLPAPISFFLTTFLTRATLWESPRPDTASSRRAVQALQPAPLFFTGFVKACQMQSYP